MGQYKPPFEITNEVLTYVSSISEKVGKISAISNLDSKPHLRKINRIKSIHSSLKIEANSLTISQVRDVINGKTVLGEQKEIQEVKNAYAAYEKLSEIKPYSLESLKEFHGIMAKYLVEEAGQFRKGEEGVFNGDVCIFVAPPARFVPDLMAELFGWMENNHKTVHPLILSAVFHYEFVFIHPFADGNGRTSRLLMNYQLLSRGFLPVSIAKENRLDYYNALDKYAAQGYLDDFTELVAGLEEKQLDRYLASMITQDQTLPIQSM